jgi:hypothetical protein
MISPDSISTFESPPKSGQFHWAWNACITGCLGLLCSSKHLFHGPQIAVKLLEYGLAKTGGIKRRPRNEGNRRA